MNFTRNIEPGSIWSKIITEPKTQLPVKQCVTVYRVNPVHVFYHPANDPEFSWVEKTGVFLREYKLVKS